MTPGVVVDVGNTRLKWGRCRDGRVVDAVRLPAEQTDWEAAFATWGSPFPWVLASVQPRWCERLTAWLSERGQVVRLLHKAEIPLALNVAAPENVGIDRLLDAVAVKRLLATGEPAVIVDAGSAVTVDWLDENHVYCGGAIFPGLRLMAEALHAHTAQLPLVSVQAPIPGLPAQDTVPALQAGIYHAVAGGIERIAKQLMQHTRRDPRVVVTGGDGALLANALQIGVSMEERPLLTLEGIVASVEGLAE